jgi:hypothetical protein
MVWIAPYREYKIIIVAIFELLNATIPEFSLVPWYAPRPDLQAGKD